MNPNAPAFQFSDDSFGLGGPPLYDVDPVAPFTGGPPPPPPVVVVNPAAGPPPQHVNAAFLHHASSHAPPWGRSAPNATRAFPPQRQGGGPGGVGPFLSHAETPTPATTVQQGGGPPAWSTHHADLSGDGEEAFCRILVCGKGAKGKTMGPRLQAMVSDGTRLFDVVGAFRARCVVPFLEAKELRFHLNGHALAVNADEADARLDVRAARARGWLHGDGGDVVDVLLAPSCALQAEEVFATLEGVLAWYRKRHRKLKDVEKFVAVKLERAVRTRTLDELARELQQSAAPGNSHNTSAGNHHHHHTDATATPPPLVLERKLVDLASLAAAGAPMMTHGPPGATPQRHKAEQHHRVPVAPPLGGGGPTPTRDARQHGPPPPKKSVAPTSSSSSKTTTTTAKKESPRPRGVYCPPHQQQQQQQQSVVRSNSHDEAGAQNAPRAPRRQAAPVDAPHRSPGPRDDDDVDDAAQGRMSNGTSSTRRETEKKTADLAPFLTALRCEKYVDVLAAEDIRSIDDLRLVLRDTDLATLGLPVGPRRRIQNAIEERDKTSLLGGGQTHDAPGGDPRRRQSADEAPERNSSVARVVTPPSPAAAAGSSTADAKPATNAKPSKRPFVKKNKRPSGGAKTTTPEAADADASQPPGWVEASSADPLD